jgi:hypothetical protein
MVHILSYVPETRGQNTPIIEEPIKLYNVEIALRNDGKPPKRIYTAPEKRSLNFTLENGYVSVTVPVCNGYCMIVFEER